MKLQRRTLVLGSLGALALAGLLGWAFAPRPLEVEVAPVMQGPFETTLDEDGYTRLRERYLVSAPLSGRLARLSLREGDRVAAGAPLARIAPTLAPLLDARSEREALARVATAQALLQRAASRIERARVGQAQAEHELARSEPLAAQGFVSPGRLDEARLAVAAARSEADTAALEREVAARELAQARAALGTLREAGAGRAAAVFEVRAPVSGQVLKLHQLSEGVVTTGAPLLELGDTRRLEVVAELLTSDALQIPPGAAVRIDRWGGAGELAGQVRRIEPAAVTKVSALGVEEQRVKVLIDLTSPPVQWAALGDGFRVGVRIVTLSQPQALQVPVAALFPLPAGVPEPPRAASVAAASAPPLPVTHSAAAEPADARTMALYLVDGDRARLQTVRLLARNGRQAWIRAELQPGRPVLLYPPAALRDGQRVRVRRV
ncbi:MAG: HlyD family efflux transporter periplasmic adaptor subunit [Burkholderiaceae bacterium]|nr:HlyD family efflux transporter periplasmic adaptor subunit [Burkholderiaceae bacterium]